MKHLLLTASILLLACLSCVPTSKIYNRAMLHQPFEVIIVPGVPYDSVKWSDVMKARVYWAKYLLEKGIAKEVIFSGSAVYTPFVESEIMALYAEKIGIPIEKIHVETKAEHSTENLYYSYQLARKLGFSKIALATDPYQAAFMYKYAKNKKIRVNTIPILMDTLKKIEKTDPVIDATSAYVSNFKSLIERESFFKRLRGTMGKNIVFEKE